jgi:hypothetical protein
MAKSTKRIGFLHLLAERLSNILTEVFRDISQL